LAKNLLLEKMRKSLLLAIISLSLYFTLTAQDILTVMHYNLLYYGQTTGFCNNSNNSLSMKDPSLKLILDQIKPDIFTVNEIASNDYIHQHLLDQNLNTGWVGHYKKASFNPVASSNIVNMLYYDSRKLRLKKQYVAQSLVRDIDVYELYYYSNDLEQGDTAFIICVVAHLKAGSSTSDIETRRIQVDNTMRFIEPRYAFENVLFMGDFNFYSGYEPGFQLMLSYPVADMRFLDPIGQVGDWHANPFYAGIHTQSTHTNPTNGCAAGGGMDDRFDFILISDEIRFGTRNVLYLQESYKAFGQDGQRFNSAINSLPANSAVSQEIANALFNVSDHLPVVLQLRVDKVLQVPEQTSNPFMAEVYPMPVSNVLNISFYLQRPGMVTFEIIDSHGRIFAVEERFFNSGKQTYTYTANELSTGFYLVGMKGENGDATVLKLVKTN
jgi:hypothetical protein